MNLMRRCLGIATIAVGLSSCAAPVNDAASTPTSHEQAPSWSLPKLGRFDSNDSTIRVFRPCQEVPDELLASLGYQKLGDEASAVAPYTCPLVSLESGSSRGAMSLEGWDLTIEDFRISGTYQFENADYIAPGAVVGRPEIMRNQTCSVMLETQRGVVGVSYTEAFASSSNPVTCEKSIEMMKVLIGG